MKKIIAFTLLVVLVMGCEGDFLSTSPSDQYTSETFWQTEEHLNAGIAGVYQTLRGQPAAAIRLRSNLTPNSLSYHDPGGWRAVARGLAIPTNELFEDTWTAGYHGIGRANTVIDNAQNVDADEAYINEVIGEAKFLRAFYYADLGNSFGGVPLIVNSPDANEHSDLPRSSKDEVINQVLDDLDDAASVLPVSNAPGRATRGAALALKSRVLLFEERWAEAATTAKQVMDLGHYDLFPDYRGMFMLENENNSEIIFDIQFKQPESGHGIDQATGILNDPSPTLELVNAYLMVDGRSISDSPLYDPENPYENRDPRLYHTVRLVGYMYNGQIVDDDDVAESGFGSKKFLTYADSTIIPQIPGGQSETNLVEIRYAEVLLTYAEAQNEAVGPDESVYNALNQIRSRVNMPLIEPGLTQDEMREVIRHERRIELAMEGKYYFDILRWGNAEEVLNEPVRQSDGNIRQDRSFNPSRDYLFAIPAREIDLNPNLEQNPGW